jgi:hypothetical protein
MKERLKPAQPIDDRRIQRLVRDLDSERYSTRQDAQKELQLLLDEEVVRKSLRRALAAKPSLEVGQRLEQLLSGPSGLGPGEVLRGVRAVEILERIAIPEARQLLQALAGGAPEVRLTREAKGALARLAKCSPGPR